MLSLPVMLSFAGFIPSLVLLIAIWLYMLLTAYYLLEVNLWFRKETNMISMAQHTLGRAGFVGCWLVYLFLLYCLTTAYFAGAVELIHDFIEAVLHYEAPKWSIYAVVATLFTIILYQGTRSADLFNRLLMLGLIVGFSTFAFLAPEHVQQEHLEHRDWEGMLIALTFVSLSYGFHIIIPSLTHYLHQDVKKLKWTIFLGSAIPLMIYIVWNYLVMGIVPAEGEGGLIELWMEGKQVVRPIRTITQNTSIMLAIEGFSFFAIISSLLGVSLSLMDFLADYFHLSFAFQAKQSKRGKTLLCILTLGPAMLFSSTMGTRIFYDALDYGGAFGVVLLLGVLPVLMVWVGRANKILPAKFKVWGGRRLLLLVLLLSLFVTAVRIAEMRGWLTFVTQDYPEVEHE